MWSEFARRSKKSETGISLAYRDLGSQNPARIAPAYERRADPVIELQLEKAGVRLAHILNATLEVKCPGVPPALLWRTSHVFVYKTKRGKAWRCRRRTRRRHSGLGHVGIFMR